MTMAVALSEITRRHGRNRGVQDHALWDYPNRRYGHRITVCGDKPY
jgi:hypothetical protein